MSKRPPSKYRAVKVVVNGVRFDSKKEARRWQELQLLEAAGKISDLQRQVNFPLSVNCKKICTYRADFTYRQGDRAVVEDAKGYQTDVFKIKWKLLQLLYPDRSFVLS